MKNALRFVFVKHAINRSDRSISFYYRTDFEDGDSQTFEEKLVLPSNAPIDYVQQDQLNQLLRHLHLVIGVSYYKMWCPKEIIIENNFLSKAAVKFWNTVYTKGLGEFFYNNQIDFRGLVNFPYVEEKEILLRQLAEKDDTLQPNDGRILIGIGGGKDSILAAELLKGANISFSTWDLSYPLQKEVARATGAASISVRRELDENMLSLSKSGEVYSGHVPSSAIYAFISVLLGFLYGHRYLIFANERSSNYGNVQYLGQQVNHQWSKSREFEDLFTAYVNDYIGPQFHYFSLLRPLYEIEIVRRFCRYPQYFNMFSSCNRNFKIKDPLRDKKWCGDCPKCAFVFCLMSAFLPKEKLITIFGENLYAKPSLTDIYRQLLGTKDIKPFECVGTPDEVKVAFCMASQKGEYNQDVVMKMFETEVLPTLGDIEKMKLEVFSFGDDSNIPKQFRQVLKQK